MDDDAGDNEVDGIRVGAVRSSQLKAMFGRKRSHNEQFLIAPCGMIIAREMFFNSESLPSVAHFFRQTYWNCFIPNHLIFDNNCQLARHVHAGEPDPLYEIFNHVGLAVDVFHFKSKHKATDEYCQQHCNPAGFEELMNEDGTGWWFNTSIAEQTNAWVGGFLSICREMTREMFVFFLDEMIMMSNEERKRLLLEEGAYPTYWMDSDKL
ncbi:hypothetical protein BDZ89DRAFT_1145901 [Hymenopellis radicata]|nr:hypothetical protein BDZ89DRAFT_1145901 [Hymenopellis radicata]